MVRKTNRKNIERGKANDYYKVGLNFYEGAKVAKEFEYWNAAGVLIVHSAIAIADAITIKFGGVKCQGEDHFQILTLLKEILNDSQENKKAFTHLEKIISHKNSVSYSGDIYCERDIENMWKNFERFKGWAENFLTS